MCFSAQISFFSAALLSMVGLLTYKQVSKPSHYFFASIPLLFGIQQFWEGILWVSLDTLSYTAQQVVTSIFIVFTVILWPVWIPLSLWLYEERLVRKSLLALLLVWGAIVAANMGISAALYGVTAYVMCYHIYYEMSLPFTGSEIVLTSLYVLATVAPFFVASGRWMKLLGILLLCSCIISYLFYCMFFTSIWCFFAALLSVSIYGIEKSYAQKERAKHI